MNTKKIKAQGHEVKRYERIHYIIIEGDDAISKRARIPGEVKADEYDIFHYLNRIFIPGIEDIIGLKGITAEELLEPEDQSQLNKFIS